MKNVKKLFAIVLALVLLLTMGTAAFAANGTNDNSGSITINNAVSGQKYTIYQILVLESYNTDSSAYAYKAATEWSGFINSAEIKDVYVDVDGQGYVSWKSGASAPDFAQKALAYARTNGIANKGQKTAAALSVTFDNLNLGYYLVDSTLGTLCALNTTAPRVTIQEKNAVPAMEKTVKENADNTYGAVNDAEIGHTVSFRSWITLPAGSENVVFHDAMSAGLTLTADSIRVYTDEGLNTALSDGNYTVTTNGLNDGCSFEVSFAQAYLNSLTSTAQIYVAYDAVVNSHAVIGGDGNTNTGKLSYGDASNTKYTPDSTTKTYTWQFDILKYGNGDETKTLSGAEFVLLNTDKTRVAVLSEGKLTGWADVPAAGGAWPENTVLTTGSDGKIRIAGLDSGTYNLREIKAPAGYNLLSEDQPVTIARADSSSTTQLWQTPLTVKINNQSGTELPATGGMGTTVFYVLGGLLAVGALIFFVAKKRMGTER